MSAYPNFIPITGLTGLTGLTGVSEVAVVQSNAIEASASVNSAAGAEVWREVVTRNDKGRYVKY